MLPLVSLAECELNELEDEEAAVAAGDVAWRGCSRTAGGLGGGGIASSSSSDLLGQSLFSSDTFLKAKVPGALDKEKLKLVIVSWQKRTQSSSAQPASSA